MEQTIKGLAKEDELVSLLCDLVSIESVNPLFEKGGTGEKNMVEYICRYFDQYQIPYILQEALPGRFNVLAHLKGTGKGALCFEAHTDTVTVDEMEIEPFKPVIQNGRLYGRGSVDDKGSVAAMMYAMRLLPPQRKSLATRECFAFWKMVSPLTPPWLGKAQASTSVALVRGTSASRSYPGVLLDIALAPGRDGTLSWPWPM